MHPRWLGSLRGRCCKQDHGPLRSQPWLLWAWPLVSVTIQSQTSSPTGSPGDPHETRPEWASQEASYSSGELNAHVVFSFPFPGTKHPRVLPHVGSDCADLGRGSAPEWRCSPFSSNVLLLHLCGPCSEGMLQPHLQFWNFHNGGLLMNITHWSFGEEWSLEQSMSRVWFIFILSHIPWVFSYLGCRNHISYFHKIILGVPRQHL